jgi:chemotaxis protein MotB
VARRPRPHNANKDGFLHVPAAKAPIIVIKKKGGHGGAHGGAWKVAYADFVTAMMALFIVLWLLSSSKPVKEAVAGYFRDPSGKADKTGSDRAGVGENLVVNKDNMDQLKQQLEKAMKQILDFDKLKDHIEMTVTNEGLRIELMESAKGTFYDLGSPDLNSDGKEIVVTLAQELGELPNKLATEGHTDAKSYSKGRNYSNWELSSDRANAARRLMQLNGVGEEQVTQVRGFGDQRLRKPDAALDASNRRISVIVQYMVAPTAQDAKAADTAAATPEAKAGDAKAAGGKPAEEKTPDATKSAEAPAAKPDPPPH